MIKSNAYQKSISSPGGRAFLFPSYVHSVTWLLSNDDDDYYDDNMWTLSVFAPAEAPFLYYRSGFISLSVTQGDMTCFPNLSFSVRAFRLFFIMLMHTLPSWLWVRMLVRSCVHISSHVGVLSYQEWVPWRENTKYCLFKKKCPFWTGEKKSKQWLSLASIMNAKDALQFAVQWSLDRNPRDSYW